jgi:hypothetical protein
VDSAAGRGDSGTICLTIARQNRNHPPQQGQRAMTDFLGIGFAGMLVLLAGFIAFVLFEMLTETV